MNGRRFPALTASSRPLVYIGVRVMEGAFPSEVFCRSAIGLPPVTNTTIRSCGG